MTAQKLTYLGLESMGWTISVLICFAVACGLVFWLYKYERRLVSAPIGWSLFALRIGLLCVILLMAFQPTLTWTTRINNDKSILVAVDVSDSMGLRDEQATTEERRQWAVALGMMKRNVLGEEDSVPQEANSSEALNGTSDSDQQSDDNSVLSQTHHLTRFELVRQLLSAPQIGLLPQLDKIANTEVVLFSRTVKKSGADQIVGARETLAEGITGTTTSYAELLDYIAGRPDCSTAILLTDGVDTSEERSWTRLNRLAGESRPIYSILSGSTSQPVDLAIESIESPETVYKKDKPAIHVRVSTNGFAGKPIRVSLTDVATGQRTNREVEGDDRVVDVEFGPLLETPGRQRFIVEVHPLIEEPSLQELQMDNNQREIAINVVDDTSSVILVDGEARWEFRYLDAGFERDDRVSTRSIIFEQPYLGLLPQTFFEGSIGKPSSNTDPFDDIDLVIWGDADPRSVDQRTWESLERFVGQRGGTLVVSAGKRHINASIANPILGKMLPISNSRPIEARPDQWLSSPRNRGFHIQLTPQGEIHPLMKLSGDAAENSQVWSHLPGHLYGWVGDPKPGAAVLATPIGGTISSTSSRPAGLVVAQNYGLGRVVWLGVDSTWRWRLRRGDRDHYRFWGQMTRWASEMKTSAGTNDVRLAVTESEIEPGESTVVRARWSRQFLQNTTADFRPEIEVYPLQGEQLVPMMRFPLMPIETEPLLHEASIPELPIGEYQLRLNVPGVVLGSDAIETELFVIPPKNGETSSLAADRTLLEQFASVTNGQVFLPHQVDQLLNLLSPDRQVLEQKSDLPLWNHWMMFVALMGILTLEWVLRKWHGLP